MHCRIKFLWVLAMWLLSGTPAAADRTSFDLSPGSLTSYESVVSGLGNYYLLDVATPTVVGAHHLEYAFLELVMDVDAREVSGYVDDSPLFEVFALTGTLSGEPDPSLFARTNAPMARNVAIGQNRRVVIDITQAVSKYLADPGANHGLIFGSLTRRRDGIFAVRSGVLGEGVVARVTYFWK